jgi:tRNA threonylcarbamoyladenosine biosynthesis protein TsaB
MKLNSIIYIKNDFLIMLCYYKLIFVKKFITLMLDKILLDYKFWGIKMKIISMETGGQLCGIALSNNNDILAEYSAEGKNIHDKLCAEFVKRALEDFDLTINDIDAIAVSAGPGSFTGLRIGASIAKALCFKENDSVYAPKFIAVPSLSAFAFEASGLAKKTSANKIIAAIPAQKEILYYQEFDINGNELSGIISSENSEFEKFDFDNTILCGPVASHINEVLTLPYLQNYSPVFIARLAQKMFSENTFTDPNAFNPSYIQEFQLKTSKKELKF